MSLKVDTKIFHVGDAGKLPDEAVQTLAEAAKACRIIIFPTDTVYGVGSTGLIKAASRRIYQIKARPSIKPLPVLVWSVEEAKKWVQWTDQAEKLSQKFWPGGLTLVLKPTQQGKILTFPEYQTVAIRVPNHPLLNEIIKASGLPWVSTSANISGSPALSKGEDVVNTFRGTVDYIVSAGNTPGGESSVIDATGKTIRILREGKISAAQAFEVCPPENMSVMGVKK